MSGVLSLQKPLKNAVWWSVITLLAFFTLDAAIFRSGWYGKYLQPNSSTGIVEDHLYWLLHTPRVKKGEVLVLGDSRVAEGFSAPTAGAEGANRLKFWNFGLPGASVRNWYYVLRNADPDRHRFKAIVLSLERYTDDDSADNPPDRIADLGYSLGRLRLTDCRDFAMSMTSPERRQTALSGCLFKGLPLRADIHEFLLEAAARIKAADASREHGLAWMDGYTGIPENLTGLSADIEHGVINFPAGLNPVRTMSIKQSVLPVWAPDRGQTTAYRKLWIGRILDLYRDTDTRIIFIEMPRAPLALPDGKVPPRFLQSIAGRSQVSVIPADRFRELERPELFGDGLHLNSTGRALFSAKLSREVFRVLGIH